ncbi:hypothetical protein Pla175_09130 [Pirellulimonas nuda]|uniref:Uncharacterized protein n=1 Tax=Pirellulimonas nuda TaxID=2528009 RepID=A0A518D7W5_9BACT|nr:hypothetical protein [Pirellulimonas nuda]QDU87549.1 hypothetical protein Pla175_09130 [Pirellulimonas nuda]
MNSGDSWKKVFTGWPAALPKRGYAVTTLNEAIPFKGFVVSGEMVAFDRTNPDPVGSRVILVEFASIALLRIIDPIGAEALAPFGFSGAFSANS